MSFDAPVHLSKSSFMQRVLDYTKAGYFFHTSGKVAVSKASGFVRKLVDIYRVDLKKDARYQRKLKGLGNAELLLFRESTDTLFFILMVTEGDHPAHKLEKLKDTRKKDTPEFSGYRVSYKTRPGHDAPVRSWEMTNELFKRWRDFVIDNIRKRNEGQIIRIWHALHRTPGFSGIRADARKIASLIKAEIRRRFKSGSAFELPHRWHYYLRRISSDTSPLSIIIRSYNAKQS